MPIDTFNSEALLALPQMQQVGNQSFLIVRGEGGRDELAKTLQNRGAEVHYLNVYKRVMPVIDSSELLGLLSQNKLNFVTITSGEALQNLLAMIERHYHNLLFAIPLIVISERIRQIAADLGFKQIVVAVKATDTAILEAVMTSLKGGLAWPN
jgi:uroporphyrinogen-III synthase